jgi:hypothetical protein
MIDAVSADADRAPEAKVIEGEAGAVVDAKAAAE